MSKAGKSAKEAAEEPKEGGIPVSTLWSRQSLEEAREKYRQRALGIFDEERPGGQLIKTLEQRLTVQAMRIRGNDMAVSPFEGEEAEAVVAVLSLDRVVYHGEFTWKGRGGNFRDDPRFDAGECPEETEETELRNKLIRSMIRYAEEAAAKARAIGADDARKKLVGVIPLLQMNFSRDPDDGIPPKDAERIVVDLLEGAKLLYGELRAYVAAGNAAAAPLPVPKQTRRTEPVTNAADDALIAAIGANEKEEVRHEYFLHQLEMDLLAALPDCEWRYGRVAKLMVKAIFQATRQPLDFWMGQRRWFRQGVTILAGGPLGYLPVSERDYAKCDLCVEESLQGVMTELASWAEACRERSKGNEKNDADELGRLIFAASRGNRPVRRKKGAAKGKPARMSFFKKTRRGVSFAEGVFGEIKRSCATCDFDIRPPDEAIRQLASRMSAYYIPENDMGACQEDLDRTFKDVFDKLSVWESQIANGADPDESLKEFQDIFHLEAGVSAKSSSAESAGKLQPKKRGPKPKEKIYEEWMKLARLGTIKERFKISEDGRTITDLANKRRKPYKAMPDGSVMKVVTDFFNNFLNNNNKAFKPKGSSWRSNFKGEWLRFKKEVLCEIPLTDGKAGHSGLWKIGPLI